MQEIIDAGIESLGGYEYICPCGKKHELQTKSIVFSENAISRLGEICNEVLPLGQVLLVAREGLANFTADNARKALEKSGYNVITHSYSAETQPSIEAGAELFSYPEDVRLVIAVGDTCVMDLTKYFASIQNIPVILIPTNCDCLNAMLSSGFLYVGKVVHRVKTTFPYAVLYDFETIGESTRDDAASAYGSNMTEYITLFDKYFSGCVSGEKYCSHTFEAIKEILARNLDVWERLARGDKTGIIACLDSTVRLSILKQIAEGFDTSSAESVAETFTMIKHSKARYARRAGETKFFIARKIMSIYLLFAKNRIRDLSFPPDKGLRADTINKMFDTGRFEALKMLEYSLGEKEYEMQLMRYEEYHEDILNFAAEIDEYLQLAGKGFKRISSDLGYSITRNMSITDIKQAVSLAPDLFDGYSMLTYMRDLGLLDSYLK